VLFFVSGKVVVDDGTALTEGATLQTDCRGQRRTVGHTDSHGQFSFQLGGGLDNPTSEMPDATDTASPAIGNSGSQRSPATDWRSCELQALSPGFTSQPMELASRLNGDSYVDIGRVVVHRMAQAQGFTISATSAAAPPKAKKHFEKGLSLEKKSKWAAAQQKFQSAVDLYPRYAIAWLELGRMQVMQERMADAKQSFQKAAEADPKFLPPYHELIRIAVREKKWQELGDSTDKVLKQDPVSFPGYWFLNSAANYNQGKYDIALRSAQRCVETDVQHRLLRLQYLLGLVLAQKGDYEGAMAHIRNYLRLAPQAADASTAQAQLRELEAIALEPPRGNARQ
jgi:tetratricopeptide (TPR) repeat protein